MRVVILTAYNAKNPIMVAIKLTEIVLCHRLQILKRRCDILLYPVDEDIGSVAMHHLVLQLIGDKREQGCAIVATILVLYEFHNIEI